MPDQESFELLPYLGAGPLRFGMQPSEVSSLLGESPFVKKNRFGERDERRDLLAIRFDKDTQGVVEIEFYREAHVTFRNVSIFEQVDDAYRTLLLADGEPFESLGTIILMKLGISLSVPKEEYKTITVFSKGRWDRFSPQFKKIPLPS
jgi:hypothetical protein